MSDLHPRALVIAAHPDDAEFTSGGTIARLVHEQWQVYYAICTNGDKGSANPCESPHRLAQLREQEQRAAGKILGLSEIWFLGHPDGALARADTLVIDVARLIRAVKPDRLFAWDPWRHYQLHPDHRAAGLAALDAVLAAGNPHYFPDQLDPTRAHRVEDVYLFGSDQPDTWVDVTATFAQKMRAIEEHRSQVTNLRVLTEQMTRCNHGDSTSEIIYAEAFKVLHPFCDT